MNEFVFRMGGALPPDVFVTMTTPLLDTGAEFAKFVGTGDSFCVMTGFACKLIKLASPLGFIEGKIKPARCLTFPCADPFS